jgi:hypothetical protein
MSSRISLGRSRHISKVRRGNRTKLRPPVHSLESRTLLSTVSWDTTGHPTGGDWDTAANWVGGVLPGPSDDTVIALTATGTVTHAQGAADSVHGVTTSPVTTSTAAAISRCFW